MIQSFFILRTQRSMKLIILDLLSDLHQLNSLHIQYLSWRDISEEVKQPNSAALPFQGGQMYLF